MDEDEGVAIPGSGVDRQAEVRALTWWAVLAVVAGIVVAGVASLVVAYLAYGWSPSSIVSKRGRDDPDFVEAVKVGLTVAGGFGGAIALVVAFRRQRILERDEAGERERAAALRERERMDTDERRAQGATWREEQKSLRDRYGAAAAQLGDGDAAVRLAGVYALANLADEWEDQRQQCVDVLCAYLRLPWMSSPSAEHPLARFTVEAPTPLEQGGGKRTFAYPDQRGEVEVRKTILRVIGDHLRDAKQDSAENAPLTPGPWSGLRLDLSGATLPGLDWEQTVIPADAVFVGATFTGGAWFEGATFTGGAWFEGATFTGSSWFEGATFTGAASFAEATFTGDAVFDKATFIRASEFGGVTFNNAASFAEARFNVDALFWHATFNSDAWFHRVTFNSNASFAEARFNGAAHFRGAKFTGAAEFRGMTFNNAASFAEARFNVDALFWHATFNSDAWFHRVTFNSHASFAEARFNGAADFRGAKFAGAAEFEGTTFTGNARFDSVTFKAGAVFSSESVAPHGSLVFAFPRLQPGGVLALDGRAWPWVGPADEPGDVPI